MNLEIVKDKKCQKLLDKTKINLMFDPKNIFYTTILFSLKQQFSKSIPTAGTNGLDLYINPNFFKSLNEKERKGLLLHEIMHIALQHPIRGISKIHEIYNMAGDYVVNLLLKISHYILPPNPLLDTKYENMTTEQVYEKLLKDPNNRLNNFDLDIIFTDKVNDIAKIKNTLSKAKIQAQQNKSYGNLPAELQRKVNNTLNPKLPWNVLLQNYFTEFAKDDYSFKKPNTKYGNQFYLPSLYSESISNITVAVDTSGSVSDKQFSEFITEINIIHKTFKPTKLKVIDFDTKIKKVHTIYPYQNIFTEIKFKGWGGTSIIPILDWTKEHSPQILIIFTDGDFYMPINIKLNMPVLWIIYGSKKFKPIFGRVIYYDNR